MLDINQLWSKTNPWTSLLSHMKEVGDMAVRIITDSAYDGLMNNMCQWSGLDKESVISLVRYISAMHDIGKADPSFQAKNGEPLPDGYEDDIIPGFRHERAVLNITPMIWKDWDRPTKSFFSVVMSLHHQHNNRDEMMPRNKKWKELWFEIEKEMHEWSRFTEVSVRDFPNANAFCTILTGLIIISDWIASSRDAENAFKAMNFYHHDRLKPFDFTDVFGNTPRSLQQKVMDEFESAEEMPLSTIIEAPPGEGKTELAIWLAHQMGQYWGKNGIFFALPTTATSNQMIGRVRDYLKDDVALMHSMEWLEREKTSGDKHRDEWRSPQKRGILSRYAVGTVDQIMLSVLKVRYGALRLFGLSNKVVIIDEIHAYDTYMTEVIKRLVEWLNALRIPVIMLSATLPAERKKSLFGIDSPLNAYPLVTNIYEDGSIKQFAVSETYRHMSADIKLVRGFENVRIPDGMTCILVNTVKKAQEIYDRIEKPKMLFHSRFTAERRKEIEKEVLERFGKNGKREDFVLVATQVVEQSLDIDFDNLITELAPIDLLIQRLGRQHRHDIPGRGKPACTVFYESEYGKKYGAEVYYELLLDRTAKLLEHITEINIPEDIRDMIETVYTEEVGTGEFENFVSRSRDKKIQQFTAMTSVISRPAKRSFSLSGMEAPSDDDTAARTRLGTGYKLCILPEDLYETAVSGKATADQAREINQYSIPVMADYGGTDGTGLFSGYRFRIGTPGRPTDTLMSSGYRETLIADKEKGLYVQCDK